MPQKAHLYYATLLTEAQGPPLPTSAHSISVILCILADEAANLLSQAAKSAGIPEEVKRSSRWKYRPMRLLWLLFGSTSGPGQSRETGLLRLPRWTYLDWVILEARNPSKGQIVPHCLPHLPESQIQRHCNDNVEGAFASSIGLAQTLYFLTISYKFILI